MIGISFSFHRVIELLRLEKTPGDCLVHLSGDSTLSWVIYSGLPRNVISWILSIFKDGDSTVSLHSQCQCLITLTVKKLSSCIQIEYYVLLCSHLQPLPLALSVSLPFYQAFIHIDKIPLSLPFSTLNSPSSCSFSSKKTSSTPLVIPMAFCRAPSCKAVYICSYQWPLPEFRDTR